MTERVSYSGFTPVLQTGDTSSILVARSKICTICKQPLPLVRFARKKGGRSGRTSECKSCHKVYRDAHYAANKQAYIDRALAVKRSNLAWLDQYKSERGCARCPERHPGCLDFHHEGDKEIGIAQAALLGWSVERILKEIAKCIILCANCHRKQHFRRSAGFV
jgi:hypothetical protein